MLECLHSNNDEVYTYQNYFKLSSNRTHFTIICSYLHITIFNRANNVYSACKNEYLASKNGIMYGLVYIYCGY